MYNILLMVQIVVALGIISLVLIQHGKGADAGAAFGGGGSAAGGASGSVFGSRGASNFLSRTTAILALVFFMNSLGLAWIVSHRDGGGGSIISDSTTPITQTAPVVAGDVPEVPDSASPAVAAEGDVPEAATEATTPEPSTDSVSDVTGSTEASIPEASSSSDVPDSAPASTGEASDKSTN